MAFSVRNLLGVGGARKLSAAEAAFNSEDDSLYGVQPLGYLGNGNCVGVEALEIIKNLGDRWVFTEVSAGAAGTASIIAATATLPPIFELNTGTTDTDNAQVQYGAPQTAGSGSYTAWGPFIAKADYNINLFARVRMTSTIGNGVLYVGLADVDTTTLAAGVIDLSEAIGFYKAEATALVGYLADDVGGGGGTTSTTLTVAGVSGFTPTVNTWYDLGIRVIGRDAVQYYVNGDMTAETTMTRLPDNDIPLTPTLAIGAGTGAAATLQVQAFSVWQEGR